MVLEEQPIDETIDPDIEEPGRPSEPPEERDDFDDVPDRYQVGGVESEEKIPPKENITELTDEERAQFSSLLAIGHRVKKVLVLDRPVVIASLTSGDEIRIGAKTKEHRDSMGYARAYQVAVIAASIRKVDGKSWEDTLEADPDPDVLFEMKYEKAQGFYGLVAQYIYSEVLKLDTEFAELAAKLGKL